MSNSVRKRKPIEHWKIIAFYLIIYDIVAINFSYFFGLLLRFDLAYSSIPENYLSAFLRFAPFYTAFSLIVFYVAHMYNSVWRFASFTELNRIFVATVVTTVFQVVGITTFYERMPGSYYIVGCISQFILTVAVRFMYRYITLERAKREKDAMATHRTMIIGAGAAGQMILRELKTSVKATAKPCCVIDDNPNKWGRLTEGVPIVGGRDSIMANVEKYNIDQILFAIPTARVEDRRDILNICKETKCELKTLPGVFQLANGQVSLSKMKAVAVEDLLGRDPIKVNMEEIFQYIKGKTILVTGGGGSIGSELCRQIAGHEPKQLIIFDIYASPFIASRLSVPLRESQALTLTSSSRSFIRRSKISVYSPRAPPSTCATLLRISGLQSRESLSSSGYTELSIFVPSRSFRKSIFLSVAVCMV